MKITFILTEREKELMLLFDNGKTLSTSNSFNGWRGTDEWAELSRYNLIFHYNHQSDGDYIRYKATELGLLAIAQINILNLNHSS